jgi:hypothetical protein
VLAAALCAEGEGDPPPELSLYWQAQTYNALPRAGGLLDQPAGLLGRMSAAGNVYGAWKGLTMAKNKVEWQESHAQAWEVCACVMKLRNADG